MYVPLTNKKIIVKKRIKINPLNCAYPHQFLHAFCIRDAKHVIMKLWFCVCKTFAVAVGSSTFLMLAVSYFISITILAISLSFCPPLHLSAGQRLFPALGPAVESAAEYSAAQDPYSV